MHRPDITAIVNAHREGKMCIPSLASLVAAMQAAEQRDVNVEAVVVLDRPDEVTLSTVQLFVQRHPIISVVISENGDLGLARNLGVSHARGSWIAFLDGDDIWGRNWLASAFACATTDSRKVVWHPEFNVYFGNHNHILHHVDMEDKGFCVEGLALTNYWTSLCFAPASLMRETPYPRTKLQEGLGYEDWGWNVSVLQKGFIHKVVPGSVHGIRVKQAGSLVAQTTAASCYPSAPPLFKVSRLLAARAR
ncbi:glycosyltransferase [Rhodoplanes serenus]|uniref:Glycosyltransferase n=1 Tax=Rhodoplanes serenus TaxID=200615 RepID=A0A9X4XNC8_9BRAD|nr:glycosyltransferase family A protein [Rhodoplanes serenus]MTW17286.1 glycosyltransferase [Rhodoplanes serenus]